MRLAVRHAAVLALIVALAAPAALAARGDMPPAPARHFSDQVGLVSSADAARLADALYGFEQRTGIQFVIAALPEHPGSLEDFASRVYEAWGLGDRKSFRGVLFLVFPRQGESRLEVGYGLEEQLPDVIASRILREMQQLPRKPAVDRFEYVMIKVAQRVAPDDPLAKGQLPGGKRERRAPRFNILPLIVLLFIIFGGRSGRNRWLGPLIIGSMLGGRRGGGGWGGGFGGGGGFSGGGGASGGW